MQVAFKNPRLQALLSDDKSRLSPGMTDMVADNVDLSEMVWGFEPNYVVPPGWTLEDALQENALSPDDLARSTGMSVEHINRLLTGEAPLTYVIAIQLEAATGVLAGFWNDLERGYRTDLVRLAKEERLSRSLGLLDDLPIAEMTRLGLIADRDEPDNRLREALGFFGAEDASGLTEAWSRSPAARFRGQPGSDPGALAVWLRLGELESEHIPCQPWNPDLFREALDAARSLTVRDHPGDWYPQLVAECARAGAALVTAPEIAGAPVSGAARWPAPQRALIQLRLRNEWSDIFWFSFFHEAAHLLDEPRQPIYVNFQDRRQDQAEHAADAFARRFLIPPPYDQQLGGLRTPAEAETFADDLGVHPGIVVGRLQHDRIWPPGRGDHLRHPLDWALRQPEPGIV